MDMLMKFALALFGTLGFSVIFRVPVRHIPVCCAIGALGWTTYLVTVFYLDSAVIGCFAGACMVGLLSTLASRIFKDAGTIFVIPGILCLVPGSRIFFTMEALLRHNVENTAEIGIEMLMMAGAIAMGLLVIGAVLGMVRTLLKKAGSYTIKIKDLF